MSASTFTYVGRQKDLKRPEAMRSWVSMMQRCYNPKVERYPQYGGRGIKVCDRWHDFAWFLVDMGERPAGLWLDRIDPNWHYCPENCRWSTPAEQARNKTNTAYATIGGQRKTVREWSAISGIPYGALYRRIQKGYSDEAALAPSGSLYGRHKRGVPHTPEHSAKISAALKLRHRGGACK